MFTWRLIGPIGFLRPRVGLRRAHQRDPTRFASRPAGADPERRLCRRAEPVLADRPQPGRSVCVSGLHGAYGGTRNASRTTSASSSRAIRLRPTGCASGGSGADEALHRDGHAEFLRYASRHTERCGDAGRAPRYRRSLPRRRRTPRVSGEAGRLLVGTTGDGTFVRLNSFTWARDCAAVSGRVAGRNTRGRSSATRRTRRLWCSSRWREGRRPVQVAARRASSGVRLLDRATPGIVSSAWVGERCGSTRIPRPPSGRSTPRRCRGGRPQVSCSPSPSCRSSTPSAPSSAHTTSRRPSTPTRSSSRRRGRRPRSCTIHDPGSPATCTIVRSRRPSLVPTGRAWISPAASFRSPLASWSWPSTPPNSPGSTGA